jgi:Tfp pilus assembly protein PilE
MRKQPHSLKRVALSLRERKVSAKQCGMTLREVVVCVVIVVLLGSLAVPAILTSRESARSTQCRSNLAQLTTALQTYHDTYSSYPAAAIWKQGPLGSLALHATKRIDLITYDNWALRH